MVSFRTQTVSEDLNLSVDNTKINHMVFCLNFMGLLPSMFELMLYVPVNSNGHVRMLPPFYGTFTQH